MLKDRWHGLKGVGAYWGSWGRCFASKGSSERPSECSVAPRSPQAGALSERSEVLLTLVLTTALDRWTGLDVVEVQRQVRRRVWTVLDAVRLSRNA